ncbi:autophagy protein atg9 [Sporothrix epigloea]|uniref:Autophagy-related protein 9 n=1 Tax=Sporothrix epigloea TaxID=1892477 RepID=A0ABP0DGE4_9PEZI
MSSNAFSRFNVNAEHTGRSFYHELRSGDNQNNESREDDFDVENRAGFALDEENLKEQFHDYDLEHADGLGIDASRTTLDGSAPGVEAKGPLSSAAATALPTKATGNTSRAAAGTARGKSRQIHKGAFQAQWGASGDDEGDNDDVPGSLLVEPHRNVAEPLLPMLRATPLQSSPSGHHPHGVRSGILGPATKRSRAQWEASQKQHRPHAQGQSRTVDGRTGNYVRPPAPINGRAALTDGAQPGHALLSYFFSSGGGQKGTAYDRAMWRWVNVTNLDNFIRDVYDYYRDCGIHCILLARFLHLLNVAFVAFFLTFLTQCVDYTNIRGSTRMDQILVPQCTKNMPWIWNLGLWLFAFYFIWKTMQFFIFDLRRLLNLRDFYIQLLQIPEHDMQTVSWQDVVVKVMALRDQNPKTATNMTRLQREWIGSQSKERLDAHDIANRLMRRENYMIALFNKDILDLSVPLPFLRNKQFLTRTLEWTLWFGVLDFVFDERGQVNQEFLKSSRRTQLSLMLKSRFLFAGFMNLLLAPFVACYLVVVYFLTYYNEYQKNPSALGARAYTPLAEWKFREFNELDHLFEERLNMSYPFATRYLDQFPKRKTEQVAKTVAFVAGSVMTVLAIASLVDPELFLGFEITHDRTVLFYVGIFATIWATARGMITEENSVFDPEYALRNVIEYTHYEPDHWKNRLHSYDVKVEFSELYQIKIKIFLEEILSIFFTPLILFTSLPRSSDQIIDFFREFTIHVDGLGYVCSFAVFDFNKGIGATSNPRRQEQQSLQPDPLGAGGDVRDGYYSTKHGKMAASYYGFLDNYVINPKTGIPGHHPPGSGRHHAHFRSNPAFPGPDSPTLATNVQKSHNRVGDHGRSGATGSEGNVAQAVSARTMRSGSSYAALSSPMASVLLDPHHQPSAASFINRNMHRSKMPGGARFGPGGTGESFIVEEPTIEDSRLATGTGDHSATAHLDTTDRDTGLFRPVQQAQATSGEFSSAPGMLDESAWQTSPPAGLTREDSGVDEDADVGVLGLMYQFQQAHQNHRIR